MKFRIGCFAVRFLLALSLVQLTVAQTSAPAAPTPAASALPRLVRFGGTVKDINGVPLTGVVGITFALYSEQTGEAALWLETQNVTADSNGHYTVLLGSTKPDGLPAELFTSEQARWIGVQISGQAEQPRVLLVSAPYALKAGDAETIGGFPPSAFVLAAPAASNSAMTNALASTTTGGVSPPAASDVTTTGGTANYLPLFSGTSTVIDSVLFQSAASPFKIGINTATPASTLDVNGGSTIRGTLSLPSAGVATATAGKNSQPLSLAASAFNSTSSRAVNQVFHWQAEPAGNDTTAPSGTLNLLFGEGATVPSETGLKISNKGIFTFAIGQTFPGTGTGTVTSVASGAGLTGGPITGTGTLSIAPKGVTNAMLATAYAQLGAANTFTANQTLNGTLAVSSNGNTIVAETGNASDPAIQGNGINFGIEGNGSTTSGTGVVGFGADGVVGQSGSANGNGVLGANTSTTGSAAGTSGVSYSATGSGVFGTNSATTGNAVGVYGTSASPNGFGVEGAASVGVYGLDSTGVGLGVSGQTTNGTGVQGMATGGNGVYGQSSSAGGVVGVSSSGVGVSGQSSSLDGVFGFSTSGSGVYGSTASPTGYGAQGSNSATSGNAVGVAGSSSSPLGYGVFGEGPYAVVGQDTSASGEGYGISGLSPLGYGVYGGSTSGTGVWGRAVNGVQGSGDILGVWGQASGSSVTGQFIPEVSWEAGLWGDTGGLSGAAYGIAATADSNVALTAVNNDSSGSYPTMVVSNETTETHNPVFQTSSPGTYNGTRHCTIDTSANLTCTGVVSGVIQGVNDKQTAVYAVQAAENWLEDAGSGQLANGSARIELDPAFAETVNAGVGYHVFLTPNGDSRGLYVSHKTATSFEVHEQGRGTTSVAFDYRIMAKRKGYENIRLEDLTDRFKPRPAMSHKARAPRPLMPPAKPQAIPAMAPPMHRLVTPRQITPQPVPVAPKLLPITPPRIAQAGKPELNQK